MRIHKYISEYYDNLVEKFGYSPISCDYGSSESQKIKFKILSEATNYSNKSVLDIGCGFADFATYLNSIYTNVKYKGVDISQKMIEQAKKNHPNLDLSVTNVFENPIEQKYDIVTANGIFYLLGRNAKSLMKKYIQKMYDYSNEVVAFNSLSIFANNQEDNEFYADPVEVLRFCVKITPWIVLRQDYHLRDFTIYMYKKMPIS